MHRILVTAFSLFLFLQPSAQAQEQLRVAIEGFYPPFSEVGPGGKLAGFDVDIALALCSALKRECVLKQEDWDRIISAEGLNRGDYDAIIASMSILPDRRTKFAFTKKYYTTPARFVGERNRSFNFGLSGRRWQGMENLIVGVQSNTTEAHYLGDHPTGIGTIRSFKTLPLALDQLVSGNIDLVFADSLALHGGFLSRPSGHDYTMVGPSFDDPRYFGEGIGIAVARGNEELVDELNWAIDAIRQDGTYDVIAQQYFEFDIWGTE